VTGLPIASLPDRDRHLGLRLSVSSRQGASFRLLDTIGDPRWQANISVTLALEYEEVGKRVAGELGIPTSAIDDIVDMLCARSQRHGIPFRLRPTVRDLDDDFVLELAVASRSDFLVTHNRTDFQAAERFGIEVLSPG
jgi:predicted nucleic acid-binding protein